MAVYFLGGKTAANLWVPSLLAWPGCSQGRGAASVSHKPRCHSGLMAISAVLRELSRCCSEILDQILFLLCFILESSCSHMHVLPRSDGVSKERLRSRGCFSLEEET